MNRVQEIRKERNITQVQLAKYAGISRKYLSNVENQLANPSVDVAFRISTALSVDIDKIFFDVPKSNITVYPKPLRYIDLFCGIGGFRYASKGAFDKLGINGKCVFSSDIDKYAQQAYEANFGEKPVGDITKVDAESIPDFDLLFGGFPCQAFSICGLMKGFEDKTRGTLFFDIARIIKEKQPQAFVLENVKNLASHDGGKTLQTILETLRDELGYHVDYHLLNALDFGLPQKRERIIIVGSKKPFKMDWNFEIKNKKKQEAKMEILKISSKSNPNSVAGAIAGLVKESNKAEMQAIGAGALNQAVKAVAIARGFVAPAGVDLICIPAFAEVEVEGEDRTGIKLIVESRK